jgi:hypothetical protein
MQETIEIERDGTTYTGQYSLDGINQRQLIVYYRGKKRVDTFDPRAEQPGYVECLAENLLLQMVAEETADFELDAST